MQFIITLLSYLACPILMGGMMWFMMRGGKTTEWKPPEQQGTSFYPANQNASLPQAEQTASPQRGMLSLLKSIWQCLIMCLNPKVIVGLATVGVIIWFAAPQLFTASLPYLLGAICPLSMVLMFIGMRNMSRGNTETKGTTSKVE